MGKFTVATGPIEGLKIITPQVFGDERGYFMETYQKQDFVEAGITCEFVQDNQSMSRKGVLRGLHFQIQYPQDKLVRVIRGAVFDVAVDLRQGSPTFGQWYGQILSEENKKPPQNLRRYNYCPDIRPQNALVLSITNRDGDCDNDVWHKYIGSAKYEVNRNKEADCSSE